MKPSLIDCRKIHAELQELSGSLKVKLTLRAANNGEGCPALSAYYTDDFVAVNINPKKVRSSKQLEERINEAREAVVF